MTTLVEFYDTPLNIDYLMLDLRVAFGDFEGAVYSDTMIRTALVNAIKLLYKKWEAKYQVFNSTMVISPQPGDVPSGFVRANTVHGIGDIPSGLVNGDVFRNPYITFTQAMPPLIETQDETPIILAATYLLRRAQVSSSATGFMSWATEDIRFSSLGSERTLTTLLEADLAALNAYFGNNRLAALQRNIFPVAHLTIDGV